MDTDYKCITQASAYQKLTELASSPYDLTGSGALQQNNRLASYICRSENFNLYYGTQRIDDQVLALFQDLTDELGLVEQFRAMRRGRIMNRIDGFDSENRQVLHTACRDLFSIDPCEPEASKAARRELEKVQSFLSDVDSGELAGHGGKPFTTMVHIGIGGSDLGPRAIYEALAAYTITGRAVHFISNVDPDDAARVLQKVDLSTTLVNVVSKSGTTLETLTNEKLVEAAFLAEGLDPRKHFLAVTGEGSPMDDPGKYLRSFYMYDYIGGRYSSTSMVGAVSLGFSLGVEQLLDFLLGASEMDNHAEESDIRKNIPLLLALLGVWNHNFLGYPTLAVLPYSQALQRFPAHLQQCDMESNGKSVQRNGAEVVTKTGPVIWGEPGTNGQHAFYQLLHQGTEIVPVEFIGCKSSQFGEDINIENSSSQQKLLANLYAQIIAMATGKSSDNPNRSFAGNRPSSLLMVEQLSPLVMGGLLALYEAKIVFQGFIWNINSFDQEGVQLGKVLASRFLGEISGTDSRPESLENYFLKQL
jgi:glucose-6-phosphate isomerase